MTDKQKLLACRDFLQWILDRWELDTKETQDKAEILLKELLEGV